MAAVKLTPEMVRAFSTSWRLGRWPLVAPGLNCAIGRVRRLDAEPRGLLEMVACPEPPRLLCRADVVGPKCVELPIVAKATGCLVEIETALFGGDPGNPPTIECVFLFRSAFRRKARFWQIELELMPYPGDYVWVDESGTDTYTMPRHERYEP